MIRKHEGTESEVVESNKTDNGSQKEVCKWGGWFTLENWGSGGSPVDFRCDNLGKRNRKEDQEKDGKEEALKDK